MYGLYLKDFIQLNKKLLKPTSILIILSILVISLLAIKQDSWIVITFLSILLINSSQSLFLEDNKNNWLEFVYTVPISKYKIIFARYAFVISLCFIVSIISSIYIMLSSFITSDFDIHKVIVISLCLLFVSLFYSMFILPFLYLFTQNGLTIGVISLFSLVIILIKIVHLNNILPKLITNNSNIKIIAFSIIFILIIFLISFYISIIILKYKKETFND